MLQAALLAGAFLIGAIPFGYLVARMNGVDILSAGSGNIGATNVYRVLGTGPFIMVWILDVGKGLGTAFAARSILDSQEWALCAGLAAVAGHCLSPFLKFRGGKGVATSFGTLLGSSPWVGLCVFGVFGTLVPTTKYVSVASIAAAISVVVFGLVFADPWPMIAAYVALAVFVVWRHRGNIRRLMNGTEPRFQLRKSKAEGQATSFSAESNDAAQNASSTVEGEAPAVHSGASLTESRASEGAGCV
jgi:glycerol-3-phosphate acyltransferase PlsY